jgi:hypothetical protein
MWPMGLLFEMNSFHVFWVDWFLAMSYLTSILLNLIVRCFSILDRLILVNSHLDKNARFYFIKSILIMYYCSTSRNQNVIVFLCKEVFYIVKNRST